MKSYGSEGQQIPVSVNCNKGLPCAGDAVSGAKFWKVKFNTVKTLSRPIASWSHKVLFSLLIHVSGIVLSPEQAKFRGSLSSPSPMW